MNIAVLYTVFAALAILVNVASQELVLALYQGSLSIYLAILTGTATGLIFKYFMDKRYIFRFFNSSNRGNIYTFAMYAITGIATTLLFWASELAFDWYFGTASARYLGAVLGLGLGYWLKYHLDSRFVFKVSMGG